MAMWTIEVTDEFAEWYHSLPDRQKTAVEAAVDALEDRGPALGRPLVGEVVTELIDHLKELIPPGGNLRILFVFDPRRTAILLLGGDKTGAWKTWYRDNVPLAARLYEQYLVDTEQLERR